MSLVPKDDKVLQEILQAAREIFSKFGLKKSTMEDVARSIGKGKSTLYYYYSGKNELFEAVIKDELDKHIKNMQRAISNASGPLAKLKALFLERLELKKQLLNLGQVVQQDFFDNFETLLNIKKELEITQVGFVKEIVREGIEGGEFRNLSEEDITLFSYWVVAGFGGLDHPVYTSDCLKHSDVFTEKVTGFILYGLKK